MSRKKLKEDVEKLKEIYSQKESPIRDLKWEDETLVFHFVPKSGNAVEINIYPGDDYPENIMCYPPGSDPRSYSKRLPEVMDELLKELCKMNGMEVPKLGGAKSGKEEVDLKQSANLRSSLLASTGSQYSEEDEPDEYDPAEQEFVLHDDLVADMNNLKIKYNRDSITTREFPVLDLIDVELHLDISFLQHSVCQAWNVERFLPLIIRMSVSAPSYRETAAPQKVEVKQTGTEKCGVASQLSKILEQFVRENWKKQGPVRIVKQKDIPPLIGRDKDIAALVEMGFTMTQATNACRLTKDLREASNLLLTNPSKCNNYVPGDEKKKISQEDEQQGKQRRMEIKKQVPSGEFGFLVQLMEYAKLRIKTLPDFCVICDQPHIFASGLLKATVCQRELCVFAFQQLGVMADAANEIATQAEVVDLLVCFAIAAAKSNRRELIFEPYPTVVDPNDPKKMVLTPKTKDFPAVERMLDAFPSVQEMMQADSSVHIREVMDKKCPHSYALLQWITSSNRSHLVKLPENRHLKTIQTKFQYLLLSAPPEKEAKFKELKKQYGSCYAFHGSYTENWHSILRNGLKNASGTKFQLHGAAYGAGIYLSPHAATSFGYVGNNGGAQSQKPTGNFLGNTNFFCVALCEVINTGIKKSGSIWTSPSEDNVMTKFFFAYAGAQNAHSANTEDANFIKEIQHALAVQEDFIS